MNATGLMRSAGALCIALVCTAAWPQEIRGVVSGVVSGDRVVLRTVDRTIDVKLAQIEAPPRDSLLGAASRRSLQELCYGKAATLMETGTALDGSTIGKLSCAGIRADEEQVRRGLTSITPRVAEFNSVLRNAQMTARNARRGLWAQS